MGQRWVKGGSNVFSSFDPKYGSKVGQNGSNVFLPLTQNMGQRWVKMGQTYFSFDPKIWVKGGSNGSNVFSSFDPKIWVKGGSNGSNVFSSFDPKIWVKGGSNGLLWVKRLINALTHFDPNLGQTYFFL